MKLSIVMAVYNEAATVETAVRRVLDTPHDKELIIVNDGSTDGTREILERLQDPRVRVYHHDRNQGKGASLRTAFPHIQGEIIIIQDADLEYKPKDYATLIQPILDGDADVVYGSRFLGGPHRVLFIWHYLGNRLLTLITNLLYDVNLSDVETGYKAFTRQVLKEITFTSSSFSFEIEFTAKVVKHKFRIFDTPISYAGRTYAEGKKVGWKDGAIALWCLLKYRLMD